LYIVKNVIEQHGGHVDATSVGLGQGSVFMATLPLVL
jgi:signal transduction histidine kinase